MNSEAQPPQLLLSYCQSKSYNLDKVKRLAKNSWAVTGKTENRQYILKRARDQKEQYFLQNEFYWLTSEPAISGNREVSLERYGNWQLLVCNYLFGESFAQVLRRSLSQPNHAQCLAPLIVQLWLIITNCHANNCVHGDLKPSNLLIVSGQLTPIDFANARLLGSDDSTRPYFSYSPSYSLAGQRLGLGKASVCQDWFSFFMLLEIAMQAQPATVDWTRAKPLAGVFDASLEKFCNSGHAPDEAQHGLHRQLNSLRQLDAL